MSMEESVERILSPWDSIGYDPAAAGGRPPAPLLAAVFARNVAGAARITGTERFHTPTVRAPNPIYPALAAACAV